MPQTHVKGTPENAMDRYGNGEGLQVWWILQSAKLLQYHTAIMIIHAVDNIQATLIAQDMKASPMNMMTATRIVTSVVSGNAFCNCGTQAQQQRPGSLREDAEPQPKCMVAHH